MASIVQGLSKELDSKVHVVFNEEDLPFEEELLRNPHSLKSWLRYIEAREDAPTSKVNMLYERALKELPGSYKLWYRYLKLRRLQARGRCVTDPLHDQVSNCFERALVFMHKMPRIWMDYCTYQVGLCKVTKCRRIFDRALRALPVTQHPRIWPLYIKWVKTHHIPETALRIYRRYLQLCPDESEDFVDYLISVKKLDDAAVILGKIVNDNDFVSKKGKSNHTLWHELCELISKNPSKIKSLNVDAIIRGGLRRYTDQVGHLWNSLADYYIRSGLFERARDIYEEAIQTVTTVRDFTHVFDAYAQFEELALAKRMEDAGEANLSKEEEITLDLYMARFEDLIERRPLLLNSVLLRQNPHNVAEWQQRVELFKEKPHEVINTFTEAVQTVDPKQAVGKLPNLWVNFAKFYEENEQLDDARVILEKAKHVAFLKVDDLAYIWCEYVEMELRHEFHDKAIDLLKLATFAPEKNIHYNDKGVTVQKRLHKSLKMWSLYADLEESFGTFKTTKACYDRILELKIPTPQIIINYGLFLKENNYFEEAFKAYEKGAALFKWPNVFDIWNTYLTEFLERYGGTKLERARDLFEQCLETCPETFAKPIYLLYAKLEEQYGMARHAMAVYERSIEAVAKTEKMAVFNIYLKKAAEIYGVTRTREIYEKAIEVLEDTDASDMCLRFAEMETKLGEIDRARAIYGHCSQMCDPRVATQFWSSWKDFEVRHGNEDTLREMLRIKRSVEHQYNTQVNMMSAQMLSGALAVHEAASVATNEDSMKLLEAAANEAIKDKENVSKSNIMFVRGESQSKAVLEAEQEATVNPDEIDLDDDDDEDDDDDDDDEEPVAKKSKIEEQAVPSEVFGSLKKDEEITI
jgi:pre-mRNA-splicing factor SYF1